MRRCSWAGASDSHHEILTELMRRVLREEEVWLREVRYVVPCHSAGEWKARIQTQFCLLLNHQYLLALLASLKALGREESGTETALGSVGEGHPCILFALCSPGASPKRPRWR